MIGGDLMVDGEPGEETEQATTNMVSVSGHYSSLKSAEETLRCQDQNLSKPYFLSLLTSFPIYLSK